MTDSRNKKTDEISIKERLNQVIKNREAEEQALKKMMEKLEEASVKKLNKENNN